MRVVVSGASGLVGAALCPALQAAGHEVVALVRSDLPGVRWDPEADTIDAAGLEGCDAVIHLAGENIAGGRWNHSRKARIRDSRIHGTRLIAETLAGLETPPRALITASAIGYYGHRYGEVLPEYADPGTGFLPDVCGAWESAAEPAREAGIRVATVRLGVVLSQNGGALAKMLTPFRLGVGGRIGKGDQYMSWIALDDVVGVFQHVLAHDALKGPVNGVAPHPVTNLEFTKTLGRVLSRPTILPLPAIVAKLALGEMAQDLLLASTRVEPERLKQTGYRFRFPELEGALRYLLNKPSTDK